MLFRFPVSLGCIQGIHSSLLQAASCFEVSCAFLILSSLTRRMHCIVIFLFLLMVHFRKRPQRKLMRNLRRRLVISLELLGGMLHTVRTLYHGFMQCSPSPPGEETLQCSKYLFLVCSIHVTVGIHTHLDLFS